MKPKNRGLYISSMTFFFVCNGRACIFFSSEKGFVLFVAGSFKDAVSTGTVFLVGTGESFMKVQGICGFGQPFCEAKFLCFLIVMLKSTLCDRMLLLQLQNGVIMLGEARERCRFHQDNLHRKLGLYSGQTRVILRFN